MLLWVCEGLTRESRKRDYNREITLYTHFISLIIKVNSYLICSLTELLIFGQILIYLWSELDCELTVCVLLPGSHHALCLCIAAWGTASVGFPGRRPQERLGVVWNSRILAARGIPAVSTGQWSVKHKDWKCHFIPTSCKMKISHGDNKIRKVIWSV